MNTTRETVTDAYRRGFADGVAQAAVWVADMDHARWALIRQHVRETVARPSFAELCDRRGEHDRAEAARAALAAGGFTPATPSTTAA